MPVFPAVQVEPGEDGSLIDRDMQYEFRGFLFGSGTSYVVEEVDGILGLPAARSNDDVNEEGHGEYAGIDLLGPRIMPVKMNILGTYHDIQPKIDAALVAFQTSKRNAFMEFPLVTKRPTHDRRFVYARARNAMFPSNYDTALGKAKGGLMFHATDPRFYSLIQTVTEVVAGENSASGQNDVIMLGNFADGTDPVIEIAGPATNPRITNIADGNCAIRLDVVVPINQKLVIDVKRKHVTLQGVNVASVVRADNQWWSLLPGANRIVYTRNSASLSSKMTIRHHDAWVGA